jgi:iron complex outermembrane receptor protein
VYQPTASVSLYASYVRSFIPTTPSQRNSAGTQFAPEHDVQYEVGAKANALAGKLSATVAFFDIQKHNVLTPDPLNPIFSVQTGGVRSKGAELEVRGTLRPGWSILTSYSLIQAQVTSSTQYAVGNVLPNAPRNSGAIWTTYELGHGSLKGLGLSAGLIASSVRAGNIQNTFIVPGYGRLDLGGYYTVHAGEKNSWRLNVNIQNALDRTYYLASSTSEVRPGSPFAILGGIRWTRQ